MEFIDLTVMRVGPDDTFKYHCFRCGECCHNVKESIMLTTWDLFRLAKHLNRPMEEIIAEYTVPVPIGDSLFPILMLQTKPYGDACIFYRHGCCSIQEAKPLPCRLYPLNIEPGAHNGLGYCIVSQRPHHYTGETHRVGDWMDENLTPDDRRFMAGWFRQAIEFGRLMRKMGAIPAGKETRERVLMSILWLMYTCYEIQEEFWPQYERNMALLRKEMEVAAKGGSC